ncbi:MAG TPA: sigma-70 family RNA polymerase sigma factor [Phycisphaerae bacterium]|nr:sigma-70 family RNA polymerase sigma factor [Phycisphaerales bacterium]HRX83459.1 sigma-70 family RNA polymerase sigma factor [Phycisphaerae bacterium]
MNIGCDPTRERVPAGAAALSSSDPTNDRWATFYRTERRALTTYALALVGNATDAEDLLHDVLVRLVREHPRVTHPRAYVMRCLRHAAIDRRRRAARQADSGALADDGLAFLATPGAGDGLDHETQAATRSALARLAEAQREVVVLKIYAGLTFREIGETIRQPTGTVSSRYARALAELRAMLADEVERV